MPARREYTAEELAARLGERRRQARDGMARLRAARKAVNATVNLTAPLDARAHEGTNGRGYGALVTSLPTEEREEEGAPAAFSEVRAILSPTRGYVHDERHLARLSGRYSDVDLVLEAMGMASWLYDNPKRTCSAAFMTNWVKKASTRTAPKSALGRVLQQIADDPVAGPSTWH